MTARGEELVKKEKAMEIDGLHEDEVLSLSWMLARGISLVWLSALRTYRPIIYSHRLIHHQNTSALGVVIYGVLQLGCVWLREY